MLHILLAFDQIKQSQPRSLVFFQRCSMQPAQANARSSTAGLGLNSAPTYVGTLCLERKNLELFYCCLTILTGSAAADKPPLGPPVDSASACTSTV
jgi:hypothetical protein